MATMSPPPGDVPPPPPSAFGAGPPPPPGGQVPPTQPPAASLPWEDPQVPFLDALVETVKLFIMRPEEAYRRMAPSGPLGRPILYAVILGWIGTAAGQLYGLALRGMSMSFLPGMSNMKGLELPMAAVLGIVVLASVFIIIGLFIWSLIVHLFLMIAGGAQRGFDTTFRALAYAATAQLAQVVPMCGGLVGTVWSIILQIIGVAEAHGTSRGKAALAVLLPLALCCVCVGIVLAFSGAAAIAALSGAAHN